MTGWTVVLLAADAVGVAAAIVLLLRHRGDDPLLRLRIVGVVVTGLLIAYVARHVRDLGPVLTLILLILSLVPAVTVRWTFIAISRAGRSRHARRGATLPVVIPAISVVFAVAAWGQPKQLTVEELDATRFGVKVDQHVRSPRVKVTFVNRRPTLSDADGGTAVPVEQYALDGRLLTLLIGHNGLCLPSAVVLGRGPTALDVVVVVTPLKGTSPADCRPAPGRPYNMHTAIDVDLPDRLDARDIDDVGAGGAASLAKPAR
jgi:hypothetical protein